LKEATPRLEKPIAHELKRSASDGIWDMMMGFLLVIISLYRIFGFNANFGFVVIFIPYVSKAIRKKFVLSKKAIPVRTTALPSKRQDILWVIIALVFTLSLALLVLTSSRERTPDANLLLNMVGLLVSGLLIIGGIAKQSRMYVFALLLTIPVCLMQYTRQLCCNIPVMAVLSVLLSGFLLWLLFRQNRDNEPDFERPLNVLHGFVAEAGFLIFAYFILLAYYPEFSLWLKSLVNQNTSLLIGLIMGIAVTGLGIAYMTERYFIYAFLVALAVVIPKIADLPFLRAAYLLLLLGCLQIAVGICLLLRFIRIQAKPNHDEE